MYKENPVSFVFRIIFESGVTCRILFFFLFWT